MIFNMPFLVYSSLVNGTVYYVVNSQYSGCATYTTSSLSPNIELTYSVSSVFSAQTNCNECSLNSSIICSTPTPTPTKTVTKTPTNTVTPSPFVPITECSVIINNSTSAYTYEVGSGILTPFNVPSIINSQAFS